MVPLWSFGKPCLTIKKMIYIRSNIIYKKDNKTSEMSKADEEKQPRKQKTSEDFEKTDKPKD